MLAGKWALPEDGCLADEAIMFGVCIPRPCLVVTVKKIGESFCTFDY